MENQKTLFRRILDVALLAGIAVVFVWLLSVGLASTPKEAAQPAAPPQSVLAVESPYPPPPPYPPPGNAPEPSPAPNYCIGLGQWLTFTDPVAGYTISYPGEALLRTPIDPQTSYDYISSSFRVLTDCYNVGCNGLNGIYIHIYHNPDLLALQPFIEQAFDLYGSPNSPDLLTNYEETGYFTRVGINQDIRAFRVENGVIVGGGPNIFISNLDKVILLGAGSSSKTEVGPPCIKTVEILEQMLNTIVLTTPSQ